ncbi:Protein CBG25948 [Caenorhabditis briggsae]|uniref:Protein CBG25948 n=1 Tax=Caenorhabditis briggsae TaxID=6238 RepID=B6IK80_CAEBR|nr:Protein CBG25948 [Caenorhabditis briggsae]CAS00310.1 Protein CBG25948 [Caenorhabditis briggsae]
MKAYVKAPKRRSSSKSTSLRSRSTSRSQKDVPTTSAKPTAAEGRMKKTTVPKRRDSMRGPSTTLILRTKGAVTRSQFKLREELGMNKETKKPGASRSV